MTSRAQRLALAPLLAAIKAHALSGPEGETIATAQNAEAIRATNQTGLWTITVPGPHAGNRKARRREAALRRRRG